MNDPIPGPPPAGSDSAYSLDTKGIIMKLQRTLEWYTDLDPRAEAAAVAMNAHRWHVGSWPIAVLEFDTREELDAAYRELLKLGVNATTNVRQVDAE